ncbi:MAG: thioredoxin family protein [Verrucomicrobia bacterium]|nr:thioredoxin family protein [Pseudomonadota bacterium]NBS06929.1 thioredoxin family protein [Verrucomicrobiota bacterium]NBS78284.1 thioredoxin family protein [bacterium]NBS49106.1 thioredoxin family protein [Verrucomicrobiota bacterium]NBT23210.1 thioredoxin family protein [bacterium]
MARTASTQRLVLGTAAPDFTLPDPHGKLWSREKCAQGKPLVVVFACNHCPYVVHIREALGRIAAEFIPKGISFVAINSNDADQYPEDAPDKMPAFAQEAGWHFPYLVDSSQTVAHAWHAACTPDIFVLDALGHLVYAGQFDSTRPKSGAVASGADLRSVLQSILAGHSVPSPQVPSLGCNIKWKPGNEPKS